VRALSDEKRTNYVYEFTYSSAPGLREVFQCKYVVPEEALLRFRKILALTQSPFDFKIRVFDEVTKEESSFQVTGSVREMLEKFEVFLETSTGFSFEIKPETALETDIRNVAFESMSNYEKLQLIIYASFRHGKFSSLDVAEIYEATFNEEMPKSTASTYLARMWNEGEGHLERYGNRSGYNYRLRTELEDVQAKINRAEEVLALIRTDSGK
jgi:hypothetical protein